MIWISTASFVVCLLGLLWNHTQKRWQKQWEQWGQKLQTQFVLEQGPVSPDDKTAFSIQVHSTCDRALHVGWVRLVKDPAAPSALAGLLSPENSVVDQLNLDLPLEPNGSFTLLLKRNESLDGTDGTGRITVEIDEPPDPNGWPVPFVVHVPLAAGEAAPASSIAGH